MYGSHKQTHRCKVTSNNGQANGQRSGTLHIGSPVITHGLHGKDQDEGDQRLHEEGLQRRHKRIYCRHTQRAGRVFGGQSLKHKHQTYCRHTQRAGRVLRAQSLKHEHQIYCHTQRAGRVFRGWSLKHKHQIKFGFKILPGVCLT